MNPTSSCAKRDPAAGIDPHKPGSSGVQPLVKSHMRKGASLGICVILMRMKTPDANADNSIFGLVNASFQGADEPAIEEKREKRKQRERMKIQARKENRATYDLLPELRKYLKNLSEQEHIPASQFVSLALVRFMADYEAGDIDIASMKQPSRSPRYDWNIVFPLSLREKLEKTSSSQS